MQVLESEQTVQPSGQYAFLHAMNCKPIFIVHSVHHRANINRLECECIDCVVSVCWHAYRVVLTFVVSSETVCFIASASS